MSLGHYWTDNQQIACMSVVGGNVDNVGFQDICTLMPNLEGLARMYVRHITPTCPFIFILYYSKHGIIDRIACKIIAYHADPMDAHTKVITSPGHIKRCGIRAKCKQSRFSNAKVTFSKSHLTSARNDITIGTVAITPQDCNPMVPGLLCGILSKCWLCMRVSYARPRSHKHTQMDIAPHVHTEKSI